MYMAYAWGPTVVLGGGRGFSCEVSLQGYLTHKKTSIPVGPPSDPTHRPTVESEGGAFSRIYPLLPTRLIQGHVVGHSRVMMRRPAVDAQSARSMTKKPRCMWQKVHPTVNRPFVRPLPEWLTSCW